MVSKPRFPGVTIQTPSIYVSRSLTAEAVFHIKKVVGAQVEVPEEAWPAFLSVFSVRSVAGGEALLSTGASTQVMGLVLKGLLRTYYERVDGSVHVRHFSAEGGVFGAYGSSLRNQPSAVSIDALEDSEVAVCSFVDFRRVFSVHPCWQEYGRKLAEQLYLIKERREAQLLMLSATDRYRDFLTEFGSIQARLAQKHIASYLGITAESLSRIRRAVRGDSDVQVTNPWDISLQRV